VVGIGLYVVFAAFGVVLLAGARGWRPADVSAAQPAALPNA